MAVGGVQDQRPKAGKTCSICEKPGHTAAECWFKDNARDGKGGRKGKNGRTGRAVRPGRAAWSSGLSGTSQSTSAAAVPPRNCDWWTWSAGE